MRRAPLLFLLFLLPLPGCVRDGGDQAAPPAEKTAQVLAALIETASKNREAGRDPRSARAAADSVLKSESMTREEFRAAVRALNRDVSRWRPVSEEASRVLEGRLAARGGAR
jgi:hypothetical protein